MFSYFTQLPVSLPLTNFIRLLNLPFPHSPGFLFPNFLAHFRNGFVTTMVLANDILKSRNATSRDTQSNYIV